ncbi:hypothetical protein [Roseibium sp.]|nr:hypothetical protein [Roseibium sp.]
MSTQFALFLMGTSWVLGIITGALFALCYAHNRFDGQRQRFEELS